MRSTQQCQTEKCGKGQGEGIGFGKQDPPPQKKNSVCGMIGAEARGEYVQD